jgi:hypothetical protein
MAGVTKMDVLKALRELYLEKSRLDRLISICESKIKEQDRRLSRSKRGRKSMSMDERQIVSERMRNYWAKRRTDKEAAATTGQAATEGESEHDTDASQPGGEPSSLETADHVSATSA